MYKYLRFYDSFKQEISNNSVFAIHIRIAWAPNFQKCIVGSDVEYKMLNNDIFQICE